MNKERTKKNKYITNIYIELETKYKLDKIANKMKRSNNNTIEFLINNYYDNEKDKTKSFIDNWSDIDLNGKLDNINNIRDFAYDD